MAIWLISVYWRDSFVRDFKERRIGLMQFFIKGTYPPNPCPLPFSSFFGIFIHLKCLALQKGLKQRNKKMINI